MRSIRCLVLAQHRQGFPNADDRQSTRTVRVPEKVRLAITTMVEEGLDFVAAGKRHGRAGAGNAPMAWPS